MTPIAFRVTLAMALLAIAACDQSHTQNSSGSNWLRCDELADCKAAKNAVACDSDGYCADAHGERIERTSEQLMEPDPDDGGAAGAAGAAGGSAAALCPWGIDDLLRAAGATVEERFRCGQYSGPVRERVPFGVDCFDRERSRGHAVEFMVSVCYDCTFSTTYVATSAGDLFTVYMQDRAWVTPMDPTISTRVQRCDAIELQDPQRDPVCVNAVELQSCRGIRADVQPAPRPSGRAAPRQVSLGPESRGPAPVPLHIYVSNQSFERPWVDIQVRLADTPAIEGEFDVAGQHNWILFDFEVAPGPIALAVTSAVGGAGLEQTIDVPAERWIVIDYWYSPGDAEGERFTASLHEMQPGFE